jgi:hypothetical protein
MNKDQMRARRQARRARGECTECGTPAPIGPRGKPRSRCREHLDVVKRESAERHRRLRAASACIKCGAPAAPGYVVCLAHRERRAWVLRRARIDKIARNECARCMRPALQGYTCCARCQRMSRGHRLLYRRRRGVRSIRRVRCPACAGWRADHAARCRYCRGKRLVTQRRAEIYAATGWRQPNDMRVPVLDGARGWQRSEDRDD